MTIQDAVKHTVDLIGFLDTCPPVQFDHGTNAVRLLLFRLSETDPTVKAALESLDSDSCDHSDPYCPRLIARGILAGGQRAGV